MRRGSIITVATLVFSLAAFGQGRQQGGSNGAGNMGRQQTMGGQQGSMAGQQDRMRDQQQQRIHATTQQRQQIHDCTQATSQLRKQVRDMSRVKAGGTISADQAKQWREQLRNEVRNMNQEQERMFSGLTPEQRTATQDQVQQMEQSRERLQKMSDALGLALEEDAVNADKVRTQARDMQTELDRLRDQQRTFQDQLAN
jgi:chromosome segregation ATPase